MKYDVLIFRRVGDPNQRLIAYGSRGAFNGYNPPFEWIRPTAAFGERLAAKSFEGARKRAQKEYNNITKHNPSMQVRIVCVDAIAAKLDTL